MLKKVVPSALGMLLYGVVGLPTAHSEGLELEEIVVTAQKTSELLSKTAVAVTAVTADTLKATGTVDATGLTSVVPSLQVSYNNSNTTFTIRGIGSNTDAVLGDAAIAFHIDGVFQGRPAGASGLFYDIARVEVLRGPQGTLYGRNATGGAINIITNQPTLDKFEGSGEVEAGNYNLIRTSGMVNAPISDTVAVRAAFQTQRHSGYLSSGYNDADDIAGRLQFLFKPSEDLSLVLGGDYFHQGGVGRGVVALPLNTKDKWSTPAQVVPFYQIGGPTDGDLIATYTAPKGWTDNTSWMVHGELNWKIGSVLLTDIAAYHKLTVNYLAFFNDRVNTQDQKDTEVSNELRLSSADPDARIKWVAGAFYHNEQQPYTQQFYDNVAGDTFSPTTRQGGTGFACCSYMGQGTSLRFVYPTINNPSYAAFGQLTFKVTDAFRLTGGLRYNHDHKEVVGGTYRVFGSTVNSYCCGLPPGVNPAFPFGKAPVPTLPNQALPAGPGNQPIVYPAGTVLLATPTNASVTWTSTNWKAGAEWDVTPDSLAYLTAATGYKQGGIFAGAASTTDAAWNATHPHQPLNTYDPEKLTAYEVGLKNRFMDNKVQLNLDGFYYDYKNYQVTQLQQLPLTDSTGAIVGAGFGDYVTNAPKATEYGMELESAFVLTEADRIDLSAAYTHAKFGTFLFPQPASPPRNSVPTNPPPVDITGTTPAHTPEFTGTLSYRHQWSLANDAKLTAFASVHAEASQTLTVDHQKGSSLEGTNSDLQKSYQTYQAQLQYATAGEKVTYSFYVKNITNEAVMNNWSWSGDETSSPYASLSPPRTYGVVIGAKF